MTAPTAVIGGIGILISLIWVGALIAKRKGYRSIPGFLKAATLIFFVGSLAMVLLAPRAKFIEVVVKLSSSEY